MSPSDDAPPTLSGSTAGANGATRRAAGSGARVAEDTGLGVVIGLAAGQLDPDSLGSDQKDGDFPVEHVSVPSLLMQFPVYRMYN